MVRSLAPPSPPDSDCRTPHLRMHSNHGPPPAEGPALQIHQLSGLCVDDTNPYELWRPYCCWRPSAQDAKDTAIAIKTRTQRTVWLTYAHSFRAHPAEEVYVTGTFDNWSKSEKMAKVGDAFEKSVELPDTSEKIYYKVGGIPDSQFSVISVTVTITCLNVLRLSAWCPSANRPSWN